MLKCICLFFNKLQTQYRLLSVRMQTTTKLYVNLLIYLYIFIYMAYYKLSHKNNNILIMTT